MEIDLFPHKLVDFILNTWDPTPARVLRWVLVSSICLLAIVGLTERRHRQKVLGLLLRTYYPVTALLIFSAIPWAATSHVPDLWREWWPYAISIGTLLLGLTFWLPQQGVRLSWHGAWDFRHPLPHDRVPGPGQNTSPRTGLRLLGYVLLLTGFAGTTVPGMITRDPHAYPGWFATNGFLFGLCGLFVTAYGGKLLKLARRPPAPRLPSRPARPDAWKGVVLWPVAWLLCLAGLTLSLDGMRVVMDDEQDAWWSLYLAFLVMVLGGWIFTQGRRILLVARRLRARVIPSPTMLEAGSYVLYLRPFDDDRQRTAMHEYPLPGIVGATTGFLLSRRSAEEHIADVLRPVGPMVAVGAPGERLPHVGAFRLYLPEEPENAWQEPVRELMLRSRLTVLTLGTSEGTMWELVQALRLLPPQRLVLFVPPMGKDDYEHIRKGIEAAPGPTPPTSRLPEFPDRLAPYSREPVAGVIVFAPDRTPALHAVRRTRGERHNLFAALTPSLTTAFEALAAHERRTGRSYG